MSEQKENTHTTVVHDSGSGGAGWFLAIIILIAIAIGGWYIYQNMQQPEQASLDVNVTLPTEATTDAE